MLDTYKQVLSLGNINDLIHKVQSFHLHPMSFRVLSLLLSPSLYYQT